MSDLDQPWLEEGQLRRYLRVTQNVGLYVINCWGFIDGTVMPICRPSQNQLEAYNGHRRTHALKYQYVVLPSGRVANLNLCPWKKDCTMSHCLQRVCSSPKYVSTLPPTLTYFPVWRLGISTESIANVPIQECHPH